MKPKLSWLHIPVLICAAVFTLGSAGIIAPDDLCPAPAGCIAELHPASGSPADYDRQWNLARSKFPEAWEILSGGRDIIVAVLDTGIDGSHTELKGKIKDRTSFTGDSDAGDVNGHGTHVGGIIAANPGDAGITGAAYDCSMLDVKVAGNNGSTDARKVAEGIIWAADHGARVINISLTINSPYPYLEYAVNYAWERNCVIVAAAGNNCSAKPVYPAAYPHVLSVAATGMNDLLAKWSNRGEWVNICAPGAGIYSAVPGNKYAEKNGTSCSTALVSGEAALLLARAVDANGDSHTNDEVFDLIVDHFDPLTCSGSPLKRINAFKAAAAAESLGAPR